ncbi:Nramp family divalent metal transporter [Legionella sp. km772]|uniref:Nramp family divalent metal transporter n=1 Tax=Legionella sp. km772 TaxID=2498111 RepID=UPI000F8D5600|nr:Nramp family divalent metal transporter [Legionella sp. km772]RUR06453.1 divalent metal cation transporter [Legionella sp. km772]
MPKKEKRSIRVFLKQLGPGLITGASDDDPSGIVTYTQAGAQFGLMTLWTVFVTFPLMLAIQEMCARIGLITGEGLTSNIQKHYSPYLLFFISLLTIPAIILNISANIAGMGAVANLLVPSLPAMAFSVLITFLLILTLVFLSYKRIVNILKYLCVSILLYLVIPFLIHTDWISVFKASFAPHISFKKEYFAVIVAILGTTISPYLFFWQATMEAEKKNNTHTTLKVDKQEIKEMKQDVSIGMFFSNLVMYFIILTAGVTLFPHGIHQIDTVEQAAKALEPLAGSYSYWLFAAGVIGTGFLSVPVLSGSLSYMVSTIFNWKTGLNKKYYEAKLFYMVITLSLLVGLAFNFFQFSPMKALFYTAILYGLTAPVLILIILHISNNKKIMGKNTNGVLSNFWGVSTFILMLASCLLLWFSA